MIFRFVKNLVKTGLAFVLFVLWLVVLIHMVSPLVKLPIIGTLQTVFCYLLGSVFAFVFSPIVRSLINNMRINPKAMSRDALIEKDKENTHKINQLKEEIALLKGAQCQVQHSKVISEVALKECVLNQNDVKKETLSTEECKGIFADTITKDSLVIHSNEITAKFGVDFGKIRVAKRGGETLFVSGIETKYIGIDKSTTRCILSEIRETKTKNGISETKILNGKADTILAAEKEREAVEDWQKRLSQGLETKFIDESVKKDAQERIRLILAPLGMHIEFTNEAEFGGISISDFLEEEVQSKEKMLHMEEQFVRRIA